LALNIGSPNGYVKYNYAARPGLYQCSNGACCFQFTATTRTPLHATKSNEWKAFVAVGQNFAAHETVQHGRREYVRGPVHAAAEHLAQGVVADPAISTVPPSGFSRASERLATTEARASPASAPRAVALGRCTTANTGRFVGPSQTLATAARRRLVAFP
jgi:hypothetical protein